MKDAVPAAPVHASNQERDRILQPAWAGAARVSVLALSDLLTLLLAGALAVFLWAIPVREQSLSLYLPVAPAALLVIAGYAQAGLYPGFGLGPVEQLRRYWTVTAVAFMTLAALTFALKVPDLYSRVTVTLAMSIALVLVPGGRWLVTRFARRWPWWAEPVLLISDGNESSLSVGRSASTLSDFLSVGRLQFANEVSSEREWPLVARAAAFARRGVQVVVIEVSGTPYTSFLEELRIIFPRVILIRSIDGMPVEGVQIRNLGGVLGIEYSNNLLHRQSRWVKRTLDVLLGALSLIILSPVILAGVIAVKLSSPGPALYWQGREGRGGRHIRVPKIRTMVMDADNQVSVMLEGDPALRTEWEAGFKLRSDPRVIPKVGTFLRRYSIDELPQLWCVVRGEMSLVGPRPFPAYHLSALSETSRRLRNQVRPGLTGLWQVTARGEAGVEAQQAFDTYYIRNWSLWLDLYILGRTGWAVASGKGAY